MGFARLKWRGEGFRQTWQGRPGPDPAVPMNRDCHIGQGGQGACQRAETPANFL
jgi:hypothetical protein